MNVPLFVVLQSLVRTVLLLIGVVAGGMVVAGVTIVGPKRLRRLTRLVPIHLRESAPYIAGLVVVLLFSAVGREGLQSISQLYGLNLTGTIFAIEGGFVAWVQTHATPELTYLLSVTYVYGYAFLLLFPFLAYLALEESTQLNRLLAAYTLNYVIGLLFYTIVFAHGPRNVMPDLVTSLLYTTMPDLSYLTTEINVPTNVFPSLHTSLSVTVAGLAYRTRDLYPAWAALSAILAIGVIFSTMYLGLHWLIDVLGGIALGAFTVWVVPRHVS